MGSDASFGFNKNIFDEATIMHELDKVSYEILYNLSTWDDDIKIAFFRDNKYMRSIFVADIKNIYKYCCYLEWLYHYKKISNKSRLTDDDIKYINWLFDSICKQ